MKQNKFFISLISFLFLFLAACNANDQALDDRNMNNVNDNISSMKTDSTSDKYPHTQPVKIQEAKYEFKTVQNDNRQNVVEQQLRNIEQAQRNTQQQTPNTQQQNEQNRQQQEQNNGQPQQNAEQSQPNNTPQKQEQTNQGTQQQAETTQDGQTTQEADNFVTSVIELTNVERQNQGLPPLKADTDLNNVAKAKAQDMQDKGYFSHTSPTYGSPFDMMRDFGISYQSAAENIAHGQRTPEEVVDAWMNSEGHRANILDENMTHIGVGVEKTGYHWAQMFIKK